MYDSDWNPQVCLQAQDRCHRIGQKRNVRVFRFITNNSIEKRILALATKKLQLERLVIQKGNFKGAKSQSSIGTESLLDMLSFETTMRTTFDHPVVISNNDLKTLLLERDNEFMIEGPGYELVTNRQEEDCY